MLGSESTYFKTGNLVQKRKDVITYLRLKKLSYLSDYFLEAFDFFVNNPDDFDGATGVKDLTDIQGLTLSAMRHDYDTLMLLPKFKGLKWTKYNAIYAWQYGKNLELLGKGIFTPYLRAISLIVATPFYWILKKTIYK